MPRLTARGYSNEETAARLYLSVKTIEVHKADATRMLGVTSRMEVVRQAILHGWLREK